MYRLNINKKNQFNGQYMMLMRQSIDSMYKLFRKHSKYENIPFGYGFIDVDLTQEGKYILTVTYKTKKKDETLTITGSSLHYLRQDLINVANRLKDNADKPKNTFSQLETAYESLKTLLDKYELVEGEYLFCFGNLGFKFSRSQDNLLNKFITEYGAYNLDYPLNGYGMFSSTPNVLDDSFDYSSFFGRNDDEYSKVGEVRSWYRISHPKGK